MFRTSQRRANFSHTKRKSRVWDCFQLLLIPKLHWLAYYSNPTENIRTRLVLDFRELVETFEYFLIFYKFIDFRDFSKLGFSWKSSFLGSLEYSRFFSNLSSSLRIFEFSRKFRVTRTRLEPDRDYSNSTGARFSTTRTPLVVAWRKYLGNHNYRTRHSIDLCRCLFYFLWFSVHETSYHFFSTSLRGSIGRKFFRNDNFHTHHSTDLIQCLFFLSYIYTEFSRDAIYVFFFDFLEEEHQKDFFLGNHKNRTSHRTDLTRRWFSLFQYSEIKAVNDAHFLPCRILYRRMLFAFLRGSIGNKMF